MELCSSSVMQNFRAFRLFAGHFRRFALGCIDGKNESSIANCAQLDWNCASRISKFVVWFTPLLMNPLGSLAHWRRRFRHDRETSLRASLPAAASPFAYDDRSIGHRSIGQTLEGSFSAESKPNFASKYAFESSRRDLHNALLCTVL